MSQATELIARQFANGAANARVWADILYNVKLYGARGDWNGTTGTDDTASVQATIDAAIAAGGKAVFFPHGTYKVTALTNLSSVVLFGDNASFSGISDIINQIGSPSSNLAFNVKEYGAKGDGVTDDATAIQKTIDTASAAGGGIVFLPAGSYFVGTTIVLRDGVSLAGAGMSNWDYRFVYGTWLIAATSLATLIEVGNVTVASVGAVVRDLNLTRQGFTNGGAVGGVGLWERRSYSFFCENVYLEGFSVGVRVGDLTIVKTLEHHYVNTNISDCDVFINVQCAAEVTFNGGRIGTNAGNAASRTTGVKIEGSTDTVIFNQVVIAHNGGLQRNVHITNASVAVFWVTFNDCDMETATVNSVLCDTEASMIRINDSWVGSAAPMTFSAGDRIIVRDCTFPNQPGVSSAVLISGAGKVLIEDNDFLSSPTVQILVTTPRDNITIKNNHIENGGGAVKFAPDSGSPKNWSINDNKMTLFTNNAIEIDTTRLSGIQIKDNFIRDYTNYGMLIGGGVADASLDIQGNRATTTQTVGSRCPLNISTAIFGVRLLGNDFRGNVNAMGDSSVAPKIVANNL